MEMQGKVALVTGPTNGIGEATARMFAEVEAVVMLAGRRENLLKEITEDLNAKGCQTAYTVCDVTNEEQVKILVSRTMEVSGRLDCAYNNAGIMPDDVETAFVESLECRTKREIVQRTGIYG